jgi:hypothetical protein
LAAASDEKQPRLPAVHPCIHEKRNCRGVNYRELLADTSALTSYVPAWTCSGSPAAASYAVM